MCFKYLSIIAVFFCNVLVRSKVHTLTCEIRTFSIGTLVSCFKF